MINRQTLLIILLFAVALLAWRWSSQGENENIEAKTNDISLPSFTATKLHSRRYTADGRLTDIFTAEQALYYEHNKVTDAITPVLQTFEPTGQTAWNITAKIGQLIGNDRLMLHDNIVIKNHNPALNIDRMQTSYLDMDMNTRQISSDKPVTIDSPDYHVQGVGLHADLNSKRYQILEQSHATYFKPR
jgi:lipopolysaccharide export system protein LptC